MLIGLFTLFIALFGGNVDIFYVDKIEQGVKKEVTDKERKKEIQDFLKDYTKEIKEFNKARANDIKELKAKSLERTTDREWYNSFFKARMDDRNAVQESVIDKRLQLQKMILSDEWARIMENASVEATKLERKQKRKEMKQQDKNFFRSQEKVVKEQINDQGKEDAVLAALETYESAYDQISEKLESIDVNNSDFLDDKNATREDMMAALTALNEQRMELYNSYTDFYFVVLENTTDEEWKPIIKEITKTFK